MHNDPHRRVTCWIVLMFIMQGFHCPFGQCDAERTTHPKVNPRLHIQVGEFQRAYRLHLPPTYDGTTPLPLVLVFHGRSEGARDIAESTGFNDLADRQGFIVVYPIGIKEHWNDGRNATPIWGAGNYDDVGFIQALLEHLQATLAIDPRRLYATGMSNGAMFVQRLACELPDTFAAIGPVAGTLPSTLAPQCTGPRPLSVIEFHGTKDAYVLWHGGSVRALGGRTLSVLDTVAFWKRIDGCPSVPHVRYEPHREAEESTRVRREVYGPCQDGSEVVLYAIEGGGHTWPNGPADGSLPFLGRVTHDISATEALWTFFAAHPKRTQAPIAVAKRPAHVPVPQEMLDAPTIDSPTTDPLPTILLNVLFRFLQAPFTLSLHPLFTTLRPPTKPHVIASLPRGGGTNY